jgi:serine/threonine-protein kinase
MSNREQVVLNGRYELHRRIGRGGMAEVFLARDRLLDRPVAIKILFPEFATDPAFVARFRREAQSAANLTHPNIVGVYDWGKERGTYYIVMEYVDGRSVSEMIRSDGPLDPKRAAALAAEVAAGLGFAHSKGVVHRDVKPGNILIAKNGEVKVADFGIAWAMTSDAEDNLTQAGSVMGTATYFSPEQAQGKTVDPRSDLYSLGVVLYEMVAGQPPYGGESPVAIAYKHVQEPLPPLRGKVRDIPLDYEAITTKALAKSIDDRYQTAADLRADLLAFGGGRPVGARRSLAAGAVAAGAVAAGAVAAGAPRTAATPAAAPPAPAPVAHEPVPAARSNSAWFFVAIVVLLVVLAGLLFAFGRQLGIFEETTPQVAVPNVVGEVEAVARQRVENQDLVARFESEASDRPVGEVLRQEPVGGAVVDEGSTVLMFVSAGLDTAVIPNLFDRDVDDARGILLERGFDAASITVRDEETDRVAPGRVIRTEPGPGTHPLDTPIVLVVAVEPATTTTESTTTTSTTTTTTQPTTTTSTTTTTTRPTTTTSTTSTTSTSVPQNSG